jgi:hypothetical protein
VYAYPKLKNEIQGYPHEAEIERALLPFIQNAIFSAFRLSEFAIDEVGKRMSGIDKRLLAETVYAILPNKIGSYDIVFIKRIVPKERFVQLIQDCYDQFLRYFNAQHAFFEAEFVKWARDNLTQPQISTPEPTVPDVSLSPPGP